MDLDFPTHRRMNPVADYLPSDYTVVLQSNGSGMLVVKCSHCLNTSGTMYHTHFSSCVRFGYIVFDVCAIVDVLNNSCGNTTSDGDCITNQ